MLILGFIDPGGLNDFILFLVDTKCELSLPNDDGDSESDLGGVLIDSEIIGKLGSTSGIFLSSCVYRVFSKGKVVLLLLLFFDLILFLSTVVHDGLLKLNSMSLLFDILLYIDLLPTNELSK
uniref:Transmembrane protein n=1 Tax=Pithovirus LCPAC101 TaxID=2506586 RepID=A0A481Z2G7_9VIRU|nr:MAG: hypothetical protein LCPAC101_01790 [Pithovirus LCPAC101]